MSYISHEDFKSLMSNFQGKTPKKMLKEAISYPKAGERGNVYVWQLKKGDILKATGGEVLGVSAGATTPSGQMDVTVKYPNGSIVTKSWGKRTVVNVKDKVQGEVGEGNAFTKALAQTPKGGTAKVDGHEITDTSSYDDPSVKKEGYADNYPGSWGYREGKELKESDTGDAPISKMSRKDMIKFLGTTEDKAKDMSDKELRDAVAEKSEDMKEGLHMPPLQATGQTISTVEEDSVIDAPFGVANPGMKKQLTGPGLNLSNLTTDERKQLGEFVDAIKTTRGAIEELLKKASGRDVKVKEDMGGNRTELTMTPTTVSEDVEGMVSPKLHTVFQKLIKALKDEGLDDADIEMFIKYEMEQAAKEAVAGQYDL